MNRGNPWGRAPSSHGVSAPSAPTLAQLPPHAPTRGQRPLSPPSFASRLAGSKQLAAAARLGGAEAGPWIKTTTVRRL